MLVKFDFMVGFYFIKQRTAGGNLGIGLTLLEGARVKLAPEPAA